MTITATAIRDAQRIVMSNEYAKLPEAQACAVRPPAPNRHGAAGLAWNFLSLGAMTTWQ